jgi:murein DD-endopeptidase MepM/ murein hydrolase activator NlpD
MLTTIWTVTVRGIAVLTAALAVGAIVISLKAVSAQAGPPDGAADAPVASSDPAADAEAQPLQPVLATGQTEQGSEDHQAASPTSSAFSARYAAPSEALAATRARAVSGQTNAAQRPRVALPANRRLAAVLDVGSPAPAGVVEIAQLVKQALESRGYDVSLLEGDAAGVTAPPRPDAYVSVRTAPADTATGVEAWFCQVEGALGGQLADRLLKSLATAGVPNVGQGDSAITNPEDFSCSDLLAGRARMPAVLLEIPALASDESDGQALTQGLADGLQQFFQKYRSSLLQSDQRPRLVWPALGPITSHFGPSHPLGIDIGQSEGAIVAATDGIVVFAGGDPCCSYGLYTVVQSPEGITTLYGHLESISVTQGQSVRQGQALGVVGCTGHCFGTHLHFEVIEDGVRRDPLSYLP